VFGPDWATSPRRFGVTVDRDVAIPMPDGTVLVGDVFRPDTDEPVPVIAGFHPYNNEYQAEPMMPAGFSLQRGWLESGDPYFFARRGYAHGVFNVRGTGKSTGLFQAMGPPPLYLDRPFYQLHQEALRWFDHWLAGNDTGFMTEPAVRLFVPGTGEWKSAAQWPLPQTRWTEFYLHQSGLLSEHHSWPWDGVTAFEDSPFGHGEAVFRTPPMVETTEIIGPLVLRLFAATTDTDALFFVTVFTEDGDGVRDELSRGWLRASQAELDPGGSAPWLPRHRHERREPVVPGQLREYQIPVVTAAARLRPGQRFGVRVKAADDEPPADMVRGTAVGHVARQTAAVITIAHGEDCPSALIVPVTEGNVLGTFISGGVLPATLGPIPAAKIAKQKAAGT